MPVLLEPDLACADALLKAMPPGSHTVVSADRVQAWLGAHPDEYVVVLGPDVELPVALALSETLRTSHPTVSVVLVVSTLDTATLARAMKSGARDVVSVDDPDAVTIAVRQAHEVFVALRGPTGATRRGRVVTVFSPKGGVGKTTIAVNLALALTQHGARKVCLVDLDLAFGDVAITLQLFPTHSIEQAIGGETSLDLATLEGLLTRHGDSLMVLAAPPNPDVRERVSPALVTRILRTLTEGFDYVVVDTAPAFDDQVLTALDETDECVLVATLDVPTLKNVKVALETLEMLNLAVDHQHLVLNRADDAVGIDADRVQSILGIPVTCRLSSSLDVAAATNAGLPIMLARSQHPTSLALTQLATEITGTPVGVPSPGAADAVTGTAGRSRSLFRRKKETPT